MDVGRGGFARNRIAKRVIRDVARFQIMPQPQSLGRVRKQRDIHPVAVVETERAVQRPSLPAR